MVQQNDVQYTAELLRMADLVTPMAIRVAATLRVADHITAGRRTASAIAGDANVDRDALDRVLRHLVVAGVLDCDETGRYALTVRGERLRDEHPSGIRKLLDIEGALGRAELSLSHLLDSVRSGAAAFPVFYGRAFWEDLAADEARTMSYAAQMGRDVARWAVQIVPAYDWGTLGHVVDVGGGDGTLLQALLDAYPTLRGTVFDQPRTVDAARARLTAAGLDGRSTVIPGDFFDAVPPGAGGYLLSAILHDWDDGAARAILRRCAEAAGDGGRVFVIEKTGADGESPRTDMDLRVLAYFGGRERGVAAIAALGLQAGLSTAAVHPAGDLSIIELTAA